MAYLRVIPRDLFNEANLLKCYGRLYIQVDGIAGVELAHEEDGSPFRIEQDPSSGALYISNVILIVRGDRCCLERPLNSRNEWPLYLIREDADDISVFDSSGELSDEMEEFLYGSKASAA